MASRITVEIVRVAVGGPYAYSVSKDGAPNKVATGLASANAANTAAQADAAALIPGGETIQRSVQQILTAP